MIVQLFGMGNCTAVPSFRGSYNVAKKSNRRSTTTDSTIPPGQRGNYHVFYSSSTDVESSVWIAIKNRRKRKPQTNRIKTTRYNIITFIPKNLFEQFRRVANIYFAILIGLNWVPVINAISKTVNISFNTTISIYSITFLGCFFTIDSYFNNYSN